MTTRIYYTDPGCRTFSAVVTQSFLRDGRPAVCLDRTAFYPTSGGQPSDTGVMGPSRVVDVIDEDERVVHVLDAALGDGARIDCAIDWDRRFDHMQQHTGQHILSAAFERIISNPTMSFHMGADTSTIDLVQAVTPGDLERVEAEANRIVWSDEPVAIRFASQQEAQRLPLRKESLRAGTLRLIDIDGFDLSACGGTHVSRTGEVGIVAVLANERFKGGSRVTFACGARALLSHRLLRSAVAESLKVLSVTPAELPAAIERVQNESRGQRKAIQELREALSAYVAREMLESAPTTGGIRLVVRSLDGYDAASLKSMAVAMAAHPAVAVALFTEQTPSQVVVARAGDVHLDASAILKALLERYGGKGGGKPELAQGGGLTGDLRHMAWTASGLLEDALQRRDYLHRRD